jgi:hypothetical protein
VHEIILASPLIEFETCKALADLLESGLIRPRSSNDLAELELATDMAKPPPRRLNVGAFPWLAIPFLVVLGFAFTIMPRNPFNPVFTAREQLWERYIVQTQSWLRMEWLARAAETEFFLHGLYPAGLETLSSSTPNRSLTVDPWNRPYRMAIRGRKLMFTGSDSQGQPVPMLILSRSLAWEGEVQEAVDRTGPGLILLP